jgi:hypothetical protein
MPRADVRSEARAKFACRAKATWTLSCWIAFCEVVVAECMTTHWTMSEIALLD